MTAKAVFASQVLAYYVTGDELRRFIYGELVFADVYVGKVKVGESSVHRSPGPVVWDAVIAAYEAERAAIRAGLAKLPPRPARPGSAIRRRKAERRDRT